MKKFLLSAVFALVAAFAATSAFAQTTASGNISLSNHFIDRGVLLSNDASLGLDLKVDNVVIPGLFITTDLQTIRPVKSNLVVYSDLGVGYGGKLSIFDASVSVNRTENGIFNNGYAYTSGNLEVGVTPWSPIRFYVVASQPFTATYSGNSTYYGAGIQVKPFQNLTLQAQANAYRYTSTHNNKFNNATLKATLNVYKDVNVFGEYSYGGNGLTKAFPNLSGYLSQQPLSNVWEAGVSLGF